MTWLEEWKRWMAVEIAYRLPRRVLVYAFERAVIYNRDGTLRKANTGTVTAKEVFDSWCE
jgi:hypothetical protein